MSLQIDGPDTYAGSAGLLEAPLRSRLLAGLVNLLVLAVVGAVSIWLLGLRLLDDASDHVEIFLGWLFTVVVPAVAVMALIWDAARIGQTPGGAALHIRTVDATGGPPGMLRALTRRETQVVQENSPGVHDPGIPALWRDVRVLRAVGQVLAVVATLAVVRWLFSNLITNLDELEISRDFDFLQRPYNVAVRDSGFDARNPIWQVILLGIQNTALTALVGILIASVLGLIVGIARLSSNKLVSWLATLYVETLRNIPPLVVIIFFGFALFTYGPFPVFSMATGGEVQTLAWQYELPGSDSNYLILSNDRVGIPSLASGGNLGAFWLVVAVAAVAAGVLASWRTRLHRLTGIPHHRVLWAGGAFVLIVVVAFIVLGGPYDWSWPAVSENGRRIVGGFATNSGYLSLTIALGCYTASFIAEIVRGSIQALPRGQGEAGFAVGLSSAQRYRYVILPQALRIAIPPYISECLNLTKNTSLGLLVAYPEVTLLIQTAIGNGNPAPQSIALLMGVYLTFSLIISLILNLYNRSVQLKER